MIAKQEDFDVIIVGTGVGGLAAAKTYLELSPQTNILLIESRSTIGGVWAKENCYDGLKTNNLLGTYEFTDFPMNEKYGLKPGQHIPGFTLHTYLTDFAHHFDIFRRVVFNTKVNEVLKLEDGSWALSATRETETDPSQQLWYHAAKLIVCSGLASTPNPVQIPGMSEFGCPVLHHGQLKEEAQLLAESEDVDTVTVIGASKTGYDAVQLFASRGKKVDWIIRQSGGGGVWMSKPWVNMGPFKVMLEHTATMRFMSWFSPCVWGDFDGFGFVRRLLHRTWLGRLLVHYFWEQIRWDTVKENGYRKESTISALEPPESLFWSARVGVLNYPGDIHDYLRSGQVKIFHKDVAKLSKSTVHLKDGPTLDSQGIVAITGWKLAPQIKYLPVGIDATLGIPSSNYSAIETEFWRELNATADKEIKQKFPYLANPPKARLPYKQSVTGYRLYRGIAPPALTVEGQQSLVFMKMVHSTSNMVLAETQALWAYAYLNNSLKIKTENVYHDTALSSRFGFWRYPWGFGTWYPEFVYDVIPYADMLLSDLGLERKRKKKFLSELFEGYTIHDYKGLNREWQAKNDGSK